LVAVRFTLSRSGGTWRGRVERFVEGDSGSGSDSIGSVWFFWREQELFHLGGWLDVVSDFF